MNFSLEALRIWNIRRQFAPIRPGFYRDLGAALKARTPMAELVREYAKADAGVLSQMMQLWVDGMRTEPGSLARATTKFVSPSDTVVIAAGEKSGKAGVLYQNYAAGLQMRARMLSTLKTPMIIPMVAMLAIIGVFGFFRFKIFADMGKVIKPEYWSDMTNTSYAIVDFVYSWKGALLFGSIFAILIWFFWSLQNWRGPLRAKLDRYAPYSVFAQLELLQSLSIMGSLIDVGTSDLGALETVRANASPWLAWTLGLIRNETRQGRTVLGSLNKLPLSPILAARIRVLARQAKPEDLAGLVVQAAIDEGTALSERMEGVSKMVQVFSVMFLAVGVLVAVAGVFGMTESANNMTDAMTHRRH